MVDEKIITLDNLKTFKSKCDNKYQDKLTAGSNITISNNVISSTTSEGGGFLIGCFQNKYLYQGYQEDYGLRYIGGYFISNGQYHTLQELYDNAPLKYAAHSEYPYYVGLYPAYCEIVSGRVTTLLGYSEIV